MSREIGIPDARRLINRREADKVQAENAASDLDLREQIAAETAAIRARTRRDDKITELCDAAIGLAGKFMEAVIKESAK